MFKLISLSFFYLCLSSCAILSGNYKTVTISGTLVHYETNEPLFDVEVQAYLVKWAPLFSSYDQLASVKTDASGKFSFTIKKGRSINIYSATKDRKEEVKLL